jgi:hypothetical protein
MRCHIQAQIEQRRGRGIRKDDVLGRCLEMQANGEPGFQDDQIRTALMGFIVGGPPQPPMVVPQALEQLLRRPDGWWVHKKRRVGGTTSYWPAMCSRQ